MQFVLPFVVIRRSRIRSFAAWAAAGATLSNCGKNDNPTSPAATVASVTLAGTPQDGIILVGQTSQLTAAPKDASGTILTGKTVVWSTSNAAVASVSSAGLVAGASAGFATISAVADDQAATVDLAVRIPVAAPSDGATQPTVPTLFNGAVILTIPPGATAPGATLNAGPAAASAIPAAAELVAGTAFTFGPEGTQFATPVSLSLKFDPTGLSAEDQARLAIHFASNGRWDKVAGSIVGSGNLVTAPVMHFGTYAVLKGSAPASVAVSAGNNQFAIVGTTLSVKPSVFVCDANGIAVEGVSVVFAVASGGGSIVGATQSTDVNGIATVGSWTLGAAAGTNMLTATVAGLPAVAFTATGAAAQFAVTTQPSGASSGVAFTTQPVVQVHFGLGIPEAPVSVTASIASGSGTLSGTTTVTSAFNGVAAFSGLKIVGSGPHTLKFSVANWLSVTSDSFTVSASVPVARFTVACIGLVCTLDASTSAGSITQYAWDLGTSPNGAATGKVVTVAYPYASTRTVILTVANGAGLTSSASQTFNVGGVSPPPQGPPPVTGTPSVLEDFSTYQSTADFLADPQGFYRVWEDVNPQNVVLDGRSMRYDFPACPSCQDFGVSRWVRVIPHSDASVREVWAEVVNRFSPNFTIYANNPNVGRAYKLLFGAVSAMGANQNSRFQLVLGDGDMDFGWPDLEDAISLVPNAMPGSILYPTNSAAGGQGRVPYAPLPDFRATILDGKSHTIRVHWRCSSAEGVADGRARLWLDGSLYFDSDDPKWNKTIVVNRGGINAIVLGANLNQGPNQLQSRWIERIVIHTSDPGW